MMRILINRTHELEGMERVAIDLARSPKQILEISTGKSKTIPLVFLRGEKGK